MSIKHGHLYAVCCSCCDEIQYTMARTVPVATFSPIKETIFCKSCQVTTFSIYKKSV